PDAGGAGCDRGVLGDQKVSQWPRAGGAGCTPALPARPLEGGPPGARPRRVFRAHRTQTENQTAGEAGGGRGRAAHPPAPVGRPRGARVDESTESQPPAGAPDTSASLQSRGYPPRRPLAATGSRLQATNQSAHRINHQPRQPTHQSSIQPNELQVSPDGQLDP